MKNTLIFYLSFLTLSAFSQKPEIAIGIPIFNNLYLNFEKPIPKFKKITWTTSLSHKFHSDNDILFSELFFGSHIVSNSIKRSKIDVGFRSYLVKFEKQKWLNCYVGGSFLLGKMSRQFNDFALNVPKDSLFQNAIYFGPEFTAGFKIIILKKITITPVVGMAYFFKSYDAEKITQRSEIWYNRNWFDNEIISKQNTTQRRQDYLNLGFGWSPNIYINFGYKF